MLENVFAQSGKPASSYRICAMNQKAANIERNVQRASALKSVFNFVNTKPLL